MGGQAKHVKRLRATPRLPTAPILYLAEKSALLLRETS